ncbi:MFS transporter [Paenibacillus thermotolerans]|uniref:MFS transporter n=1 Tax=Paenibacillus thermotolerans TaxID=3027807 RepID=UPI0023677C50|nr:MULTISPECIES: MFS transporter [unclassified Paenibacillus]
MRFPKLSGIWSPFVFELLFIMFSVEFVKGALLVSVLPLYLKGALGMSAFALGWAFSLQYIGDNLFRGPVGWLIDTAGYRWTMTAGIGITLAGVALLAFGRTPLLAVIGCFLLGTGTSPLWPSVVTGTTEVAGEKAKGTILGVVYTAWMAGTGAGPVVINLFIKDHTFTLPYAIILGLTAAVFVVCFFLPHRTGTRERPPRLEKTGGKAADGAPVTAKVAGYFKELSRSLQVSRLLYPAMFLQTFALGVLTPIVTLYAREDLKLSPNEFSLFLIIGGAATLLLLVPVGRLTDRWGTRWFLHIGIPLAAAATTWFAAIGGRAELYAAVIAVGFGYALVIPAWNALVASAVPERKRGAAWGFFLTIEGAGFVIGPLVSGKLWDTLGHRYPFLLSGAVLMALFVLHLFISYRKKDVVG